MKIGMIGCGRACKSLHLPALVKIAKARVVALADRDPSSLESVAERFGVKGRYRNHEELLENANVDIIAVCVPVEFHVKVALDALDAGKHVFIEKPLALNLREADLLIERAREIDRKVTVGFNLRHHRLIQEAVRLLRGGAIGEIEAVKSCWTSAIRSRQAVPAWRNRGETGGGALFEIAVHHFDLWRFLLDTEIAEICAQRKSTQGVEETVSLTARLTNGAVVSALFCERSSDRNELDVYGRRGRLGVSLYRFDGLDFSPISSLPGALSARMRELLNLAGSLPHALTNARRGGDFLTSYSLQWRHFIKAIQNDLPVAASLEDGRKALQNVLAARESIARGTAIRLEHTIHA